MPELRTDPIDVAVAIATAAWRRVEAAYYAYQMTVEEVAESFNAQDRAEFTTRMTKIPMRMPRLHPED